MGEAGSGIMMLWASLDSRFEKSQSISYWQRISECPMEELKYP